MIAEPDKPVSIAGWQTSVKTSVLFPTTTGLLAIACFIVGFGLWAASAPISGAAIASGVVAVSGQNLVIDHLEGGVVKEILAREGMRVKHGDALVKLEDTIAASNQSRVQGQLIALYAQLSRAKAENFEYEKVRFSPELMNLSNDDELDDIIKEQQTEFSHRLSRHKSEIATITQRINSIEQEIQGFKIQKTAETSKLELLREEIVIKKKLLERGLAERGQYAALLREEAESIGRIGSITATIAQRGVAIAEAEENKNGLIASRHEKAATQINELRAQISDLDQQLHTRSNILKRLIIRAPADGIVIKLQKNTVGSVIRPGEELITILPLTAELVADVRVSPADVDVIRIGQQASLRFVSLNTRTTPEVSASVTWISADRFLDPATREPYFGARLKMSKNLPDGIKKSQIFPGMPVDAFIKTGDRTFLEYLARPIYDSFAKAFREE